VSIQHCTLRALAVSRRTLTFTCVRVYVSLSWICIYSACINVYNIIICPFVESAGHPLCGANTVFFSLANVRVRIHRHKHTRTIYYYIIMCVYSIHLYTCVLFYTRLPQRLVDPLCPGTTQRRRWRRRRRLAANARPRRPFKAFTPPPRTWNDDDDDDDYDFWVLIVRAHCSCRVQLTLTTTLINNTLAFRLCRFAKTSDILYTRRIQEVYASVHAARSRFAHYYCV